MICVRLALTLVLRDVEVSAGGIVAECRLARGEIFLALLLSLIRADEVEVLGNRSAHGVVTIADPEEDRLVEVNQVFPFQSLNEI